MSSRHTELASPAALQEHLRAHVEGERRPSALAVIDLDRFREANDRYGASAGDVVLAAVARLLATAAAGGAAGRLAARLQGDAFALFLPGADTDDAYVVVDDLRRTLEAARLPESGREDGISITPSAGIAASPRDATGAVDLLRKAEDGPWRAKKACRNRIGLPGDERMVLKANYYAPGQLERLAALAVARRVTEASLLREALDDLLRKYAGT